MGSLRGDSRKAKEAFVKYSSLENPREVQIEELEEKLEVVVKARADLQRKLLRLESIETDAVTIPDEEYIAERYREFGETFVPPKVPGLKDVLVEQSVSYEIAWGKVGKIALTRSVDAQSMTAAVEAIYGLRAMAEGEFKSRFGVAKGDIQAFLGAMGKVEVSASYNWDEVVLEAVADFFVGAELSCSGALTVGSVENNLTAKLSGTARVGIEGTGNATLKLTPGQLHAALELSAFAGARASAQGEFSATVFGRDIFSSKLSASASVGIGASLNAHLDVGVQQIGLGFGADLTVGVGGGTEAELTLNVGNIVMSFLEAQDRLKNTRAYLDGYESLSLQTVEWERKIKALTDKYETQIKKQTKEIEQFEKQLNRLR